MVALRTTVFALVALLAAPPGAAIARIAAAPPLAAFAAIPAMSRPRLSPDGRYVAALVSRRGEKALGIIDAGHPDMPPSFLDGLPEGRITGFRWVTSGRLAISLRRGLKRPRIPYVEEKVVAIDWNGANPVVLRTTARRQFRPATGNDSIVDLLPGDADHILMALSRSGSFSRDVYRINIHSGQKRRLVRSRHGIADWLTDGAGLVRVGVAVGSRADKLYFRPDRSARWKLLASFPNRGGKLFAPLKLTADGRAIIALSNQGADTSGIVSFDIDSRRIGETLFRDPRYDSLGIVLSADRERTEAVHYVTDHPAKIFLDPEAARRQAILDAAFPGRAVRMVSRSRDDRRLLLLVARAGYPGAFYIYDNEPRRITLLARRYPGLEGVRLAAVSAVDYRSTDGMEIHGYLTLPETTGVDPPPLVVVPHGGPISRKTADFDYFSQFLASRGYAVFQPNFRGSAGYGRAYRNAGYGQWGQAMQDDIAAGVRWLIDRGRVDGRRVCIAGASFGGYAALVGAYRDAALYRCAASFAGLSALDLALAQGQAYMYSAVYSIRNDMPVADVRRLRDVSPARQARKMTIPVLLMHGTADMVVPIAHTRIMARALEKAGHPAHLVILDEATHVLGRTADRKRFLAEMGAFFDSYIGPAARLAPRP